MTIKPSPTPNPSLSSHVLLVLAPASLRPKPSELDSLRSQFPDLKIVEREQDWATAGVPASDDGFDWGEVTILLTGTGLPTREQAPKLQYVQLLSAGADRVLKEDIFTKTEVVFCTANGVHGPQISEWVIATFLAAEHRLPQYLTLQSQGKWQRDLTQPIDDAVGRRVGILGYGSIGRQTARLCAALGMEVYAYTLHPRDTPASRRDESYTPPGLGDPEGLLPKKWFSGPTVEDRHKFLGSGLDLLVVSVPLTDGSTHILGNKEFEILGKKAFVSNIARGPIIDTDALTAALREGRIRGAALDVTDPEPLPEGHALWKEGRVIITPHVSGVSTSYQLRVFKILELNLGRLSEGRELTNVVSRRDGY